MDDKNQDGGWSFVSIDRYYETAAKALLQEGLTWTVTATSVHSVGPVWVWNLRFTIQTEGGLSEVVADVPVTHEYDGPQTTGKVFSYGEKVFLRTLLKCVTGEADADSSPSKKREPQRIHSARSITAETPPKAPALDVQDWSSETTVYTESEPDLDAQLESFRESLASAKDEAGVHAAVKKHRSFIRAAHETDKAIFEKARAARWQREDELEIPRD